MLLANTGTVDALRLCEERLSEAVVERVRFELGDGAGLEVFDVSSNIVASDSLTVNFPEFGVAFSLRRFGCCVFNAFLLHSVGELVRAAGLCARAIVVLTLFWPNSLLSERSKAQLSTCLEEVRLYREKVRPYIQRKFRSTPRRCPAELNDLVDADTGATEARFVYVGAAAEHALAALEFELVEVIYAISRLRLTASQSKHREVHLFSTTWPTAPSLKPCRDSNPRSLVLAHVRGCGFLTNPGRTHNKPEYGSSITPSDGT